MRGGARGRARIWVAATLLAMPLVAICAPQEPSAPAAKTPPKKTAAKPLAKPSQGAGQKRAASKTTKKPASSVPAKAPAKAPTKQTLKLTGAFIASAELRPMAQQLAATRSAAAFSGVVNYAKSHPGEGAAAAYLALGHAYAVDHRYSDAIANYRLAATSGDALGDYTDYLTAQAAMQSGQSAQAYPLLTGFAERHPESIFAANATVMLADAHLQQSDPQGALKVLEPLANSPQASHADFQYALGRAYQLSGDTGHAAPIYKTLYLSQPLTNEANQAAQQMLAMGIPVTAAERKAHADQLFNVKRYREAGAEYHSIGKDDSSLSSADHAALSIYAAVCDLKLKHLSRRDVERLPDTADDSAALKMYMLAEISRSENNPAQHDALIAQMVKQFPASRWLEEALYSGGNMYLLKHDSKQAIYHYTLLVENFPNSLYAPSSHWRAAWMNYRLRNYAESARLMDEQIQRYPGGLEIPSSIYWRGRIYEDEEHNFGQAANYYRALSATYVNYYYGELARQRLKVIGNQPPVAPSPVLAAVHKPTVPALTGELPENDPHLIKARLLANASLNEYIGQEILASPTSGEWGALAQAEIYASYGEITRALQSMKRSGISFFALPMAQVPKVYWSLLFPLPYWNDLAADSQHNDLDPYLVASLIRQESEFNAGAVSPAKALGLMQLLPSVGKSMAKKEGLKAFTPNQLLNPSVNLQLGTLNLRQVLNRFGGQLEYTLAAYNAGDVPVRQWMSSGEYKDIAEFVESIPYTETREYVQAILRNREMYRALYPAR